MLSSSGKTILVAYASTGTGHKVAAEALYEELSQDINLSVHLIDILDFFPKKESGSKFVNYTTGLLSPIFDLT